LLPQDLKFAFAIGTPAQYEKAYDSKSEHDESRSQLSRPPLNTCRFFNLRLRERLTLCL
jgi:hypothetical protein